MEEQKIDRRIRKTKKVLLQALTKLMSEKKINNITVKELTDLADVNRSTFYLYYKDIFDMVEKIESELLSDLIKTFNEVAKETSTREKWVAFFTYLFEFVQSNAEMCKILLGPDGDYAFLEKLKVALKMFQPNISDESSKLKLNYIMPFAISGCIGIIQQWLNDNMNVPAKDMAIVVLELLPE